MDWTEESKGTIDWTTEMTWLLLGDTTWLQLGDVTWSGFTEEFKPVGNFTEEIKGTIDWTES